MTKDEFFARLEEGDQFVVFQNVGGQRRSKRVSKIGPNHTLQEMASRRNSTPDDFVQVWCPDDKMWVMFRASSIVESTLAEGVFGLLQEDV